MIILLPLLVALIGVVLYAVSNTKLAEIGRVMFFCGLLAFLLSYHGQAITVVR
jgi:Na+/phosphate symporter